MKGGLTFEEIMQFLSSTSPHKIEFFLKKMQLVRLMEKKESKYILTEKGKKILAVEVEKIKDKWYGGLV